MVFSAGCATNRDRGVVGKKEKGILTSNEGGFSRQLPWTRSKYIYINSMAGRCRSIMRTAPRLFSTMVKKSAPSRLEMLRAQLRLEEQAGGAQAAAAAAAAGGAAAEGALVGSRNGQPVRKRDPKKNPPKPKWLKAQVPQGENYTVRFLPPICPNPLMKLTHPNSTLAALAHPAA